MVMATPAFRCIRLSFPRARIVLVIRQKVAPILCGAPWFDRWIISRERKGRISLAAEELLHCARQIRGESCELGFVLPNSLGSALMLRLGGVRRTVGYIRDARAFLLTDPLARPSKNRRFRPTYMADYYLALCEAVGVKPQSRDTELPFAEQDVRTAQAILERAGIDPREPLFLLHPGAAFGPSKLWPEERFAVLADMLRAEFGAQVACIGSSEDGPVVRRIRRMSRLPVVDLTNCGIDLHLLKCVVRLSGLLVTTDSGPRHYGVALGVPTVCLMGPTHPGYSTSGRRHDHVLRVEVDCGPCQKRVCKLDHRCMERLTPEMVLDKCREALRTAGHESPPPARARPR